MRGSTPSPRSSGPRRGRADGAHGHGGEDDLARAKGTLDRLPLPVLRVLLRLLARLARSVRAYCADPAAHEPPLAMETTHVPDSG